MPLFQLNTIFNRKYVKNKRRMMSIDKSRNKTLSYSSQLLNRIPNKYKWDKEIKKFLVKKFNNYNLIHQWCLFYKVRKCYLVITVLNIQIKQC